jgi:hypothetical protein
VVAKRGITLGGGAGLAEANVEIGNVSADGIVDMNFSGDEFIDMGDCAGQMEREKTSGRARSLPKNLIP